MQCFWGQRTVQSIDFLKTGVFKAHDNITYILKDQYSNTLGFFFL